MEIDLNVIALGLTITILGIIISLVTYWTTSGQLGRRLTKVLRNQDTIMRFLLKDHQDRQNEQVLEERLATSEVPAPPPAPVKAAKAKRGIGGKFVRKKAVA